MAIASEIPIYPVSQAAFNEIDAAVMQCAYAAQNHFGRLCEEEVFENDVKERLNRAGFDAHSQVKLMVSHEKFEKEYWLDLVVNQVLYELKATTSLVPEHEAQALNYAALLGLNRVKLINFGGPKVEGKLLGSPFADLDRRNVRIDRNQWKPVSEACENLAPCFEGFVSNIGGYLRTEIYEEAMVFFYGGVEACIQRLPINRDNIEMGKHPCRLYCDDCAFVITGLKSGKGQASYARQLRSVINALPIKAFQWINIHHLDVTFTTVEG